MLDLLIRRLRMSSSAPRGCTNGRRCYSGRYRNGKAVYFYNESDNRRIYCGRFWFRRKNQSPPHGRTVETVSGCFADNRRTGKWHFSKKSHGYRQKLVAEYVSGGRNGAYRYTAVCWQHSLGVTPGLTSMRMTMADNHPAGSIECRIGKEKITGGYDGDGRPDGVWMMDSTKTETYKTFHEKWKHGVCVESYSYDDSTGERIAVRSQLPDIVTSMIMGECRPLESIIKRGLPDTGA